MRTRIACGRVVYRVNGVVVGDLTARPVDISTAVRHCIAGDHKRPCLWSAHIKESSGRP